MAVAAFVLHFLPLTHHTEVTVVERADLDRRVVLQAGGEFLDAHLHRTFAGDAEHFAFGLGQLDAHGVGNAHAHGSKAAGIDPAAWLVKAVILCGPHLVLAHVGRDVGVRILGHVPQRFHHILRLDHVALAVVVLQAILLAPGFDLVPPGTQSAPIELGRAFLDHGDHFTQHVFHVADDGNIHLHPLGDARRVDVNMDDLAFVLRKVLGVSNDAVVKACTHSQQHIAVLHGVIGFHRAVHAQHAQVLAVAGRVCTQAHQGVRDRVAQHVHQGAQLGRGIAQEHAATGVNVGSFGRQEQLERLADLTAMALAHRVVGAHLDAARITGVGHLLKGHVLGDVHQHRPGTAAARDVEGFFQGFRQISGVLDQKIVFHHRTCDAHGVAFLEGILADGVCWHLSADDHHRNAVHIGGSNTGHGIGDAGAGGNQCHTDIAGGAGITVGRMHCRLFVAHQHMLNAVLLEKSVVNVQHGTAWVTPDVLDVFGL